MDYERILNAQRKLYEIERDFEWREWSRKIPPLMFPHDWLIRIIPPFAAAMIRFMVSHANNPTESVSVYLDCYETLGCCSEPYWEIYPSEDGDTERYLIHDTGNLIDGIRDALEAFNKKEK
jgi:hypothetical protein